ncbi:MAG TPA: PIN domain-containing protein [Solirubrobacteraceae bacterium]|nr:PIN domain-containing protein [Solirubrobacteraceae bacterium]
MIVDTSAWARVDHPSIRNSWADAVAKGRLRVSPIGRLEILLRARNGSDFDALTEYLSVLRTAPLSTTVVRAAEDAMRTLSHRSHGAHRLPIVDYLLAAAAQETGAAVLHYDHDYDTLAEVMEFESVWLAPPGSMP